MIFFSKITNFSFRTDQATIWDRNRIGISLLLIKNKNNRKNIKKSISKLSDRKFFH